MNQNEQQNGGERDAEHAAWLADKIVALGDYAKEAADMLRRWPSASAPVGEPVAMAVVREGAEDEFYWAGKGVLLELPPGEYDLCFASPLPQEPTDAAMLWLCQVRDDFRRMAEDANRLLAQRCAELAALPQEPREAELTDDEIIGLWHQHRPIDDAPEAVAFARALERELRGAQEVKAGEDARDAALWRKLKPLYYSAHFFPQEMDLPEGVALIFLAPKGTRVSADLDSTVAAMSPTLNADSRGEKG